LAATAPLTTDTTVTEAVAATPRKDIIARENALKGDPISEWGLDGDGGGTIQGFATDISTNVGGTVEAPGGVKGARCQSHTCILMPES